MPIGVIWEPPVDQSTYEQVRDKVMDSAQSNGNTFHAAGQSDSGWRIVEIWDSREGLERFINESLHPAIDEVSGGQAPAVQPAAVFDVVFQTP